MQSSQILAARAVQCVMSGTTLPAALAEVDATLAPPLRSFVHELAYGTLRHWGTLRALLALLAQRPAKDPLLSALLAVALYQLMHTRQPPFAVVDQAVRAAAEVAHPGVKGFANALLRRFLREKTELFEQIADDPVARFSFPSWWIDRLRADYPEDWQTLLEAGNIRPPLTLRVNRRQTTRTALLRAFTAAGIAATALGRDGVVLAVPQAVTTLPGFVEGHFSVQDWGAQWAADMLALADGQRVLDACAAPGGKTTHILERAAVTLLALDNDAQRLQRVEENARRLRLWEENAPGLHCRVADAARPAAWWDGRMFDRILIDAPCSASGVVRRHPDVKWLRRAADLPALTQTQDALLDALWPLLAPGGRLVYVTCSLFRPENDMRIAAFMERRPEALHETPTFDNAAPHRGGQLLPAPTAPGNNQDGFYYAILHKPA